MRLGACVQAACSSLEGYTVPTPDPLQPFLHRNSNDKLAKLMTGMYGVPCNSAILRVSEDGTILNPDICRSRKTSVLDVLQTSRDDRAGCGIFSTRTGARLSRGYTVRSPLNSSRSVQEKTSKPIAPAPKC
ncbi:hypothetical protein KP509_31G021000 [Ceratopteris richardii]|uniref:Uncharacterized protein n=1 Tax=Ceratopteris richardii TaxID=49495 RepID=A0A8T2QW80_CERRI|nr:hypothetical protein KP509_31G021000 [Ceratopteris richardii]